MTEELAPHGIVGDFEAAERELLFQQSKIGAWLMLVLIPAGVTLDYFVYPNQAHPFAIYRLLADGVVLAALALHWHPAGRRYPGGLVAMWLGAAVVMICVMIRRSGGAQSTYYDGLVLSLLAIGILLPLRVCNALPMDTW